MRYYSPFAMKVTSFVFGIGGVALGEELQKDVIAENKVSWKERLTADSAIGFLFAMFGLLYTCVFTLYDCCRSIIRCRS